MEQYISTGIDTLDEMLCGSSFPLEDRGKGLTRNKGIPKGSRVLIRGEPGAGKTTLAMQILSQFLSNPKDKATGKEKHALFLSYEEDPEELFNFAAEEEGDGKPGRLRKYNFFKGLEFTDDTEKARFNQTRTKKEGDDQFASAIQSRIGNIQFNPYILKTDKESEHIPLICISRENFLRCLISDMFKDKDGAEGRAKDLGAILERYDELSRAGEIVKSIATDVVSGNPVGAIVKTAFALSAVGIKRIIKACKPESAPAADADAHGFDLIIVDSLNGYVSSIKDRHPKVASRNLLHSLCNLLENVFGNGKDTTVIFTGEYHYHSSDMTESIRESFYCDVEILLRPEPVCVPENYATNLQASIGYNLNTINRDAGVIESRSFCRVAKSRRSPNQARRCTYDIVTGKGIEFYETYPGDGEIVLCRENQKQKQAWESFFAHDIPESYPALRHEVFDRISMQSVYEGQRRLRNVPLKTDMYLSSFDSTWVSWYRNFKLKCDIDNLFRKYIDPSKSIVKKALKAGKQISSEASEKRYSRLVNAVVKIVKEDTIMKYANVIGISPVACYKVGKLLGCGHGELKDIGLAILGKYEGEFYDKLKKHFDENLEKRKEVGKVPQCECVGRFEMRNGDESLRKECVRAFAGLEPTSDFAKQFSSFLKPLPLKKLKLFGERRSKILDELLTNRKSLSEPFDLKTWEEVKEEEAKLKKATEEEQAAKIKEKLDTTWNQGHLLSVPYDANIGFFVYRKDILSHIQGQLDISQIKRELSILLKEETDLILRAAEKLKGNNCPKKEEKPNSTVAKDPKGNDNYEKYYEAIRNFDVSNNGDPVVCRMIDYVAKRIACGKPPKTWEEMIVLAKLCRKNIMLETQSAETYICTFLELLWNCGAEDLKILPNYRIEKKDILTVALLKAFNIFHKLFNLKVVDRDSTLMTTDAERLPANRIDYREPDSWLFARHWYSTLILNLTSKDDSGRYYWCDGHPMDLEIMPIPASLSRWIIDVMMEVDEIRKGKDESKNRGVRRFLNCDELHVCEDITDCSHIKSCFFRSEDFPKLVHHSCWGDWSFALLAGSENESLAIDLINNMMSSTDITDRAFNCACIPTVEDFYEMYGESQCFDMAQRPEIVMPKITFNELKNDYFANAKTRLDIYDYRHVARILHSRLETIRKSEYSAFARGAEKREEQRDLPALCEHLIKEIERLATAPILLERFPEDSPP
ncbi:MAG: RAD55 family ATPase [Planctomycetota bacterium]|jgi:hypothetical protein